MKEQAGPKTYLQASYDCPINFMQQKYSLASHFSIPCDSHVASISTDEEQKIAG